MSNLTKILVWVGVVGLVFAILWWQGQIKRLRAYWQETLEELRKCTWPTWDELKGSTVVVMLSIAVLGGFTVVTDWLLAMVFFKL